MKTKGEDAKRILELLDGTLFPLHKKWRKLTHRLDRAPELALILSLYAEKALLDGKVHTYYRLSRIVGTNYDTVKKNCRFLELLNFVEISRVEKEESASGVASYRVRITKKGLEATKNILKAKNC
ncbi:hypothetical protein CW714_04745 [Methanophagales archaeon]|nr:MAG: hypothetical protein CW714_04745 [Methanophagales archaeon]